MTLDSTDSIAIISKQHNVRWKIIWFMKAHHLPEVIFLSFTFTDNTKESFETTRCEYLKVENVKCVFSHRRSSSACISITLTLNCT